MVMSPCYAHANLSLLGGYFLERHKGLGLVIVCLSFVVSRTNKCPSPILSSLLPIIIIIYLSIVISILLLLIIIIFLKV